MEKLCDLHSHSIFSDGTWTPENLIEEGERLCLAALALTDHNTIEGLPRFLAAAQGKQIVPVPGCEFSTDFKGTELHIVGLMIGPQAYDSVRQRMADFLGRKESSNRALCQRLSQGGYRIDYDAVAACSQGSYINRAHIAYALMQSGYFSSVQEAFEKVLHPRFGYYVPAQMPDALDTVSFIRSIGAIPVLAHAFRSIDESGLRDFLTQAVPLGLLGMETLCSTYDAETFARSEAIAAEFGLLPSGGTDFHGDKKPDIRLGCGRGNLAVPASYLTALAEAAGLPDPLR